MFVRALRTGTIASAAAHPPGHSAASSARRPTFLGKGTIMDEQDGFSNLFFFMLILGILGVVGFFVVALGAGGA